MDWITWATIGCIVFLLFVPATVLFFILKHERKEWARKRSEAVTVEGVVIFSQTFQDDYDRKKETTLKFEKSDGTICTYKLDSTNLLALQTAVRGDKFRMLVYEKPYHHHAFFFDITENVSLATA